MKKILPIVIVIVIVIGCGSFYGGMLYGKGQGGPANFRGFNGQRPGVNLSGNAKQGGITSGEILSIDDKSVTLKMGNSGSKIIFFSADTKISKSVDGAVSDLAVGQNLMVTGTANSDGSISANSIQVRPAMPNQPNSPQITNTNQAINK